jgi:hypothetical protein
MQLLRLWPVAKRRPKRKSVRKIKPLWNFCAAAEIGMTFAEGFLREILGSQS